MPTDHVTETTPEASAALVKMHQLLWQASVEAYARARRSRHIPDVDLALTLEHLQAEVYDLVPESHRGAILDRPEVTGAGVLALARQAARLSRSQPDHHFPAGTSAVAELLVDTVRDAS